MKASSPGPALPPVSFPVKLLARLFLLRLLLGLTVSDTETVTCTDSGFTFSSAADNSLCTDGSETLHPSDADGCTASDIVFSSHPHDFDTVAAADVEMSSHPSDSEHVTCADTEREKVGVTGTDVSQAADSEHEQVHVYAYQTLFRWTGGGFDVPRPWYEKASAFQRGPTATEQALEPARVWRVHDSDVSRSQHDQGTGLLVSCESRPVLGVMAWARAVQKMEPLVPA